MPERSAIDLRKQAAKARDILSETKDNNTRAMLEFLAEQLDGEAERLVVSASFFPRDQ